MNILSPRQAADVLKLDNPFEYPELETILPGIDEFIKTATGRDWSNDNPVDPLAKMLASALAVRWFDDPGSLGSINDNDIGVKSLIGQLHAKALEMTT